MLVLVFQQLDLHFLLPRCNELAVPQVIRRARDRGAALTAHQAVEQALLTIVRRKRLLRDQLVRATSAPLVDIDFENAAPLISIAFRASPVTRSISAVSWLVLPPMASTNG